MAAATTNPLENSHPSPPPAVSKKTFHIAGILITVYGLEELPSNCSAVSCLWLLHPRLGTAERMTPIGSSCINDWNHRLAEGSDNSPRRGLIAVAFDQRNHGSREVDKVANEAWNKGNERHAQDMFSIFHGTAMDTSLLIDHLESYVFHERNDPNIDQNLVLGVSLGGHAAWQVIFKEPRVSAAVVIIGCPDYMRVMTDRARLSKRASYTIDNGSSFHGSVDFPHALITALSKSDPRGLLFGTGEIPPTTPCAAEQSRLRALLDKTLKNKKLLVCSGGADKLVPYHASEPFMKFLTAATAKDGWYADGNVYVENKVYEGVGHAFSEGMVKDSIRFVSDVVASAESKERGAGAKI